MKEQLYIILRTGDACRNGDVYCTDGRWLRPVKEQQHEWIPISDGTIPDGEGLLARIENGKITRFALLTNRYTPVAPHEFTHYHLAPPPPEPTAEEKARDEFRRWLEARIVSGQSNLWKYDDVVAAYEFGRKQQEQAQKP